MEHFTTKSFWDRYNALADEIQQLADANYQLLENDPFHPSLHFKKIRGLWSARVGSNFRALAYEEDNKYYWFWIGRHDEYERILRRQAT